jgi:hypothetical protein
MIGMRSVFRLQQVRFYGGIKWDRFLSFVNPVQQRRVSAASHSNSVTAFLHDLPK